MSLLTTAHPDAASPAVAMQYQAITRAFGRVPNTLQLYSSSPTLLAQQWDAVQYYLQHATLTPALLATIRMLVSTDHDCAYCVGFNESLLINWCGQSAAQVAATKANAEDAPLAAKERALLRLVLKAVRTPHAVQPADLDGLRALGWKDGDILDAVTHGARNVASDILINAFKIERDY